MLNSSAFVFTDAFGPSKGLVQGAWRAEKSEDAPPELQRADSKPKQERRSPEEETFPGSPVLKTKKNKNK